MRKNPQGLPNTCVSKGLARKAARHPTAHGDKKIGEKSAKKTAKGKKKENRKKIPGAAKHLRFKGVGPKSGEAPGTRGEPKKRRQKKCKTA